MAGLSAILVVFGRKIPSTPTRLVIQLLANVLANSGQCAAARAACALRLVINLGTGEILG